MKVNLPSAEGIPFNVFACNVSFVKAIKRHFKTNDSVLLCYHTDSGNMMQKVYQLVATYFQDNDTDEITTDHVFNAIPYYTVGYEALINIQ